jgi:hypothetical protein
MIRRLALFAALALPLAAQTADLQIVSLNPSKSELTTGERFTVSMRWRNAGPNDASDVVVTLGENSGAFVITGAGTSNWPCEPAFGGESFVCRGVIAAGAEAEMVVSMLAPSSETNPFVLRGSVTASTADPQPANNTTQRTLQITRSMSAADLSITPSQQFHRPAAGSRVTIPLMVRNAGPLAADNALVAISFQPGTRIPITASGAGWSCQNATHSPWLVNCSGALDANAVAPLLVDVPAVPSENGTYDLYARVAAEGTYDATPAQVTARLLIGDAMVANDFTRILVPLTGGEVPGQNGARWITETTAYVASDTALEGLLTAPLRQPFDLRARGLVGSSPNGQFLLVREADASKVRINSRVYDAARQTLTAGSEIPIAREHEFTSGSQSIIGIPVAPHYRHTLRVYALEGREGAQVRVSLYANDELTPRITEVRSLSVAAPGGTFPGYLQLDPAQLLSLGTLSTLRVDIEPVEKETRIWSFVSVTNNETHHVTAFAVQ